MPERPAYNPEQIETKWQKRWLESGVFNAEFPSDKPKYYCLIEFPYPSGNGLHVGHPRSNTALDIIARKRRMEGYNVLYPIGYDAFGLPTENFAIKNKIHPAVVTKKNIDHFREQLQRLGFSFDYTREVNTTDPAYYKWTQWIFLKLLENGLAYKAEMPINWCTGCKCGLANEEVVGGVCERCGSQVVRRVKSQWMLRITKYAQKLLDWIMSISSTRSRPSSATGSAAARARRWTSSSPARMKSCACSPPGPILSLARPTWSSAPNIR
jgi:leucyl-tRNA synthetase